MAKRPIHVVRMEGSFGATLVAERNSRRVRMRIIHNPTICFFQTESLTSRGAPEC